MRVFIAVEVPEDVKKRLLELLKGLNNLRRVEGKSMHVTVSFLGEIENSDCATEALKEAAKDFKPFDVSAVGLGVFPNENFIKVFWAGLSNGRAEMAELSKKSEQNFERKMQNQSGR